MGAEMMTTWLHRHKFIELSSLNLAVLIRLHSQVGLRVFDRAGRRRDFEGLPVGNSITRLRPGTGVCGREATEKVFK